MCTRQKKIYNKYTGTSLYVKCGHCPSCLQEKAAYRVSRMNAQDDSSKYDTLLVGLTYRRHDVPYILRDEAFAFSQGFLSELPVYRDVFYRKVRQNSAYKIGYKKTIETKQLCSIPYLGFPVSFKNNKDLVHKHGCIGVTYYPDLQLFMARLRMNLKRNYDFEKPFKAFCCSEYGCGTKPGKGSLRPHFHLLLWIPKGSEETFRSAIIASWPYGDLQNMPRAIERAFRASSYVASYVNSGSCFPKFLEAYFKPKHSYSKGFGLSNGFYKLPKILEKFRGGHLTMFVQQTTGNEISVRECIYPKYVIYRFFPVFKGYGRLSNTALLSCMLRIQRLSKVFDESTKISLKASVQSILYDKTYRGKLIYFNDDDYYKISVRLNNAYKRFLSDCRVTCSFYEYARLHLKIWSLYKSDVLRLHLQNEEVPINEKYDNLEDYKNRQALPVGFTHAMLRNTNPNMFVSVVSRTNKMSTCYYEHIKHRAVTHAVLSSLHEEI